MRVKSITGALIALLMHVRPSARRPRKALAPMAILSEIVTFSILSAFSLLAAFCFAAAWGFSRAADWRGFTLVIVFAWLLNFGMLWIRLGRELDDFAALGSPRPLDLPSNDC